MSSPASPSPSREKSFQTFVELFTPKLVTILREGYGLKELRADAVAGFTVAIVALPLSMAIAIAAGVEPARGLYAAIIGGFFVSALGGSRFQVGGPAGAFIVLMAASASRHGLDGLVLATFLSGLLLIAAGLLRLGSYVQLIPYPVIVGFTAGIAIVIFSSQIGDLLGLTVSGSAAHGIADTLAEAYKAFSTFSPFATAIGVATIIAILTIRRNFPRLPAILIAVGAAAAVTALFHLPVDTIGSRFGGIPGGLPPLEPPRLDLHKVAAVLPDAFAFALLGAIESLLSATVADAMTGRRHRSNCELAAQGVANVASSVFGGLVVTGTIARTATNVRAGAHGPVAGMLHALFILAFMVFAAPLAAYAPLASLAGVLAVVAWDMIERHAIATLVTSSKADAAALIATFLLTVFQGLTEAIIAGVAIGALSFIHRMAETTALISHAPIIRHDQPDDPTELRTSYEAAPAAPGGAAVYRLSGAIFFGSAASLGIALDRILSGQQSLVLDFSNAALVDSSGANAIAGFVAKCERRGVRVFIAGADTAVRKALIKGGLTPTRVSYEATIESALATANRSSPTATGS